MNETIRNEKELITTRIFDAPRDLVFEAWTKAEHLANWFGPDGFSITTKRFSAKPGGEWEFIMHGPDGTDFPNLIRFTKIVRPKSIEYIQMSDASSEEDAFFVELSFSEVEGKTKFVMKMTFKDKEFLDHVINEFGALEGQKQTLTRLKKYLNKLHS